MSPELLFDTIEDDDPEDRGDHRPTCRRIVHQILFDQARGISGEETVEWECSPMCNAVELGGES